MRGVLASTRKLDVYKYINVLKSLKPLRHPSHQALALRWTRYLCRPS